MENYDLEHIFIWAFHCKSLGLTDFCAQASNFPNTIQGAEKERNAWKRREKMNSEVRARASNAVREKNTVGVGLK